LNDARESMRHHWPEYLIEAAGLGFFMLSACVFATVLEHPNSATRQAIADPLARRSLMGLAMGLTAIAIIYSPWGQRSGAHINPAVTLTFLRLGKIGRGDAIFYVASQFAGGLAGVLLAAAILRMSLAHPSINYVATVPGPAGAGVAFLAEFVIAGGLMLGILIASNHRRLTRFTGLFAGVLVATYITVEAPLSGMSINPARTFASAAPAGLFTAIWIYFTAPVLGMLAASQLYLWGRGHRAVYCAKLNHHGSARCIFRCRHHELVAPDSGKMTCSAA
jgi:aquaporin Z